MSVNKIKVLRIVTRMNVGGPSVQITGLFNSMNHEYDQLLVYGSCEDNEIDFIELNKIKINAKKIPNLGKSINIIEDLKVLYQLIKIIREFKPDIVNTHMAKAGALGRIANLLSFTKAKSIHTFHGHLLFGYFSGFKLFLYIFTEKILNRITDYSIVVGSRVRDELITRRIISSNNSIAVPPGLTPGKITSRLSSRFQLKIQEKDFVLIWIGRLEKIKRPERLLKISKKLSKYNISHKILVVGDGILKFNLEKTAESEKLPIHFYGWQKDVWLYLAAADLLLLTSDNEGMPLSVIEASFAGIPTVSTDVGSVGEIVIDGKTGLLTGKRIEDLTNKIIKLQQNPELCIRYGENAKKYAYRNFTLSQLSSKYSLVYRKILNL